MEHCGLFAFALKGLMMHGRLLLKIHERVVGQGRLKRTKRKRRNQVSKLLRFAIDIAEHYIPALLVLVDIIWVCYFGTRDFKLKSLQSFARRS
jgi:hypothetical protein